jgi:hypothetical protein
VEGGSQRLGGGLGVGQGDLDRGSFPGERPAKLVGGVGDEAALGIQGVLLGVEGGIQPAQQPVDGVGQVLELVVGPGHGEALVQVGLGDLAGGGGDGPQGPQHPTGHQPAGRDGDRQHDRQGDAGQDQQLPQRVGAAALGEVDGRRSRAAGHGDGVTGARVVGVVGLEDGLAEELVRHQEVGDGEQHHPRDQEHPAVEQGEAQPHGAPGQPQRRGPGRKAHHGSPRSGSRPG